MLEIRELQKTYPGGVQALKGIDLEVSPGVFGLLGPNGAGFSERKAERGIQSRHCDSGRLLFQPYQSSGECQLKNPVSRRFGAVFQAEVLFNLKRIAPYALMALFSANAVLWWGWGPAVTRGWAVNSDFNIVRLFGADN